MGSRSKATVGECSLLHFVMIKPTHYDDDGYPIQWIRSAVPSNTLACLNGLAEGARRRQVLAAPDRATYADLAITPPEAEEYDTLDLYHATRGGEEAVAKKRRTDAVRAPV